MFKFEDIAAVPDEEMDPICREIPVMTFVKALKTAAPAIQEKFLRNIRPKFAEMFRKMIADHADVSDTEVAAERAKIVKIVQDLRAGEGKNAR